MKYIKKYENIKDNKKIYPIDLFQPFIEWFCNLYDDIMKKEGWLISHASGLNIPNEYNVPYTNKYGDYWQIQKDDDSILIKDDIEAEKYAKNCGLLIDDYGIIIGYNNVSFLEHPENLEFYKNSNKFNI